MADDPKQRLQTQKGITDEIKKQREELSKLIVGSLEYENKLKSVNRLEAQKKKILAEQSEELDKQTKTQTNVVNISKSIESLLNSRIKKSKELKSEGSIAAKLQARAVDSQSKLLGLIKKRADRSKDLNSTSKEQLNVLESLNSGNLNNISSLQEQLQLSKQREASTDERFTQVRGEEQQLQKILQNEIRLARLGDLKNATLGKADDISGGMVGKAQEFGEKMGMSPKNLARLGIAGFLIGVLIKAATQFSGKIDEVGETFGFLTNSNTVFRDGLIDAGNEAIMIGKNLGDVLAVTTQLSSEFGISLGEAKNLSGTVLDTAVATGLSNEEAGKLFGTFMQIGNLTAQQTENLIEGTAQLAAQEGVAPQAVLQDLAASSEDVAKFTKAGGENIAEAAIQARKLGLSIADTAKISEGLLDFQSSIEKEVEASVLVGKQLNFQRARELALNNDIAGATAEVVKQLGSEEEFNALNVIQRKALADSIGVSVSEMAKLVSGTEKLTLQSALAGTNFDDLVGQDALSGLTSIVNSIKMIGASLMKELGAPIAAMIKSFQESIMTPEGMKDFKNDIIGFVNGLISLFNGMLRVADFATLGLTRLGKGSGIVDAQIEQLEYANDLKTSPGGIRYMTGPAGSFELNPRDSVLATTNPIKVNDFVSGNMSTGGGNQNVNVNVAMKSTISGGDIRSVANGEQITQDSGYASLIGGALS